MKNQQEVPENRDIQFSRYQKFDGIKNHITSNFNISIQAHFRSNNE